MVSGDRRTKGSLIGVLAVAAILVIPAVAWACTAQASLNTSPSSGPTPVEGSPTRTTVSGTSFGSRPVTIRWNSSTGTVIGTAQGPTFSVQVSIPTGSAPDVYYIVASDGSNQASTSFRVTPRTASSDSGPSDNTGTDEGTTREGSTSGSVSAGSSSGDDGSGSTSGSTTGGNNSGTSASGSQPGFTGPAQSQTPDGTTAAAPAPSAAAGDSGPSAPSAAGTGTRTRTAGTAATSASGTGAPATEQPGVVEAGSPVPSAGTLSADLWSGFAADPDSRQLRSLTGETADEGVPSEVAVAGALLFGGLAFLWGGFAAAEVRRRRVLARA